MEPLDPRTITGGDWSVLPALVTFLWLVAFFNVAFAFAMLVAHAVVPSLIATAHIPSRLHRVRPILYILGFGALLLSILAIASWVANLPIIYDVYPKQFI